VADIAQMKAQMRARKAAKLGMTVEQFDAYVLEEQRKLDEINDLCRNRVRQWASIAANANFHNRSFFKLA